MILNSDLIIEYLQHFLILLVLYAETHYRFKYFFSYLKKHEPEIIVDLPHRLEVEEDLPVLLILKDADRYPVRILKLSVLDQGQELFSNELNLDVREPYKELIFFIPKYRISAGVHYLSVSVSYLTGNRFRECINDNHRGTSHAPFPVYIAETPLPKIDCCYYGEPHSHTNYTSDQVEFGASLTANKKMAKALGLRFFAATDHSYDLDDYPENYLKNDPGLQKWDQFQQEVRTLNNIDDGFVIIPGEEVTVRNSDGKNIHCLIYNHPDFIPGSGDSAEKWFHWRSEKSLSEALNQIKSDALAFAAHPFEIAPLLQRFFINRGSWSDTDCQNKRLQGLQLLNGGRDELIPSIIRNWTRLLLQGYHLQGLAGNDAHGNFARFRQINFPFFTMREHYYHLFGKWRTGIYLEPDIEFTLINLLNALRTGNYFMTNGPALLFKSGVEAPSAYTDDKSRIRCHALSSKEFGALKKIRVLQGMVGADMEKVIIEEEFGNDTESYKKNFALAPAGKSCYYRCEIFTDSGRMAFSNPIWF